MTIRNITDFIVDQAVTVAAPYTSPWRDAAGLNGCQFWLKGTGAATVTMKARVSPCKHERGQLDPDDHYQEFTVVNDGTTHIAGEFVDPPTVMDRPFGSYQIYVETTADVTLTVGVCQHGVS